MGCGDFSAEWELIRPLLPPERGRWASPAGDNRCFFNGMLHGLRVDCPSAMCMSATANGTRSSSVPTTDGAMRLGGSFANAGRSRVSQTTGSTSSTAPAFAATLGSGRRRGARANALDRSRAGFTIKIHVRCDNQEPSLRFILPGDEASDYTAAERLMQIPAAAPKALLADKGYYGDRFLQSSLFRGILPIIPPRSNLKVPEHPDYRRYRDHNRVERMFGKLKQQRRIATRYDKSILSFENFRNLAAARHG